MSFRTSYPKKVRSQKTRVKAQESKKTSRRLPSLKIDKMTTDVTKEQYEHMSMGPSPWVTLLSMEDQYLREIQSATEQLLEGSPPARKALESTSPIMKFVILVEYKPATSEEIRSKCTNSNSIQVGGMWFIQLEPKLGQ